MPRLPPPALQEALSLYQFASTYQGYYSKAIPTEGNYYSDSYYDDLAWAAAWIHKVGARPLLAQHARTHARTIQPLLAS